MAPKRPLPQEEPPASSSSEEDEANSSEEEEQEQEEEDGSSSEEEEEKEKPYNKLEPTREIDFGSESEDSEPETQPPPQSTRSAKSTAAKPSKPASSSPTKRPSESDPKRAKKEKEKVVDEGIAEEDPKKKQLFQRVWSDEDEIAILKGGLEYVSKKGADPIADLNGFHEFVKKSLRLDFSRDQLRNKIKRLKKRFENNAGKGKKGKGKTGEDRAFSKAHEQELYDLSKKIWGGNGGEGSSGIVVKETKSNAEKDRRNQRAANSGSGSQEKSDKVELGNLGVFQSMNEMVRFGAPRMGDEFIKQGLEIIGAAPKRAEWEEKWKKQQVAELEVFLKRAELTRELMKMALEAHMSAGH